LRDQLRRLGRLDAVHIEGIALELAEATEALPELRDRTEVDGRQAFAALQPGAAR
jgi:hypothetical protein